MSFRDMDLPLVLCMLFQILEISIPIELICKFDIVEN